MEPITSQASCPSSRYPRTARRVSPVRAPFDSTTKEWRPPAVHSSPGRSQSTGSPGRHRAPVMHGSVALFERDSRAVTFPGEDRGMNQQPRLVSVNGRLGSQELGIEVGIRLRQLDGRWLAVADFGDDSEVGIGATPRAALTAALATLGERSAAALMADPQLFGLS